MTKNAVLVFLIAIALPMANAQTPDVAPLSSNAHPAVSPTSTITWRAGARNSDLTYRNGVAMKALSNDDYWVSVTLGEEWGKSTVGVAILVNPTPVPRITFAPENVSLFSVANKSMVEVKRADPVRMVRSSQTRMAIAPALSTMGSGYANEYRHGQDQQRRDCHGYGAELRGTAPGKRAGSFER